MRKILFLTMLFCSASPLLRSQKTIEGSKAAEATQKYFELPRESIFLHLNKSTYLYGEDIWFKGYIYDQKNEKPSKATSNIYVGIYDSIGNQIDKKLFLGAEGYTRGHIKIDSSYISGTYYVKASTDWMKNFTEDDAFVQKIKIIKKKIPQIVVAQNTKYDLQILPEGGHMVVDVPNTVGFKIIDKAGYGTSFKEGVLRDQNGKKIVSFNGNKLGIGKFSFTPEPNNTYNVTLQLHNGTKVKNTLPTINSRGVAIEVNNYYQSKVVVAFRINNETYRNINGKKFKLLLHKNGKVKITDLIFDNNKKEIILSFDREELFRGVNTFTLFDENEKPLSERLVFNSYQLNLLKAELSYENTSNDSIAVKLQVNAPNKTLKSLSVSVLPENTISYNSRENIISAFLLKPHVKGFIENPSYYFKNINKRTAYDLDLLLLTQGWSRYDWNQVFNRPPKKRYELENGTTVIAHINEDNLRPTDSVIVFATKNNPSRTLAINADKTVTIENVFLNNKEPLRLGLINAKGKVRIPKMYVRSPFVLPEDKINHLTPYKSNYIHTNTDKTLVERTSETNKKSSREFTSLGEFTKIRKSDTINLDEVVLIEKKLDGRYDDLTKFEKNLLKDVTTLQMLTYTNITDMLVTEGFQVYKDLANSKVYITDGNGRRAIPAVIILDGFRIRDSGRLLTLRTSDIERFSIDKFRTDNFMGGSGGTSHFIRLYSRSTPLDLNMELPDNFMQKKITQLQEVILTKKKENGGGIVSSNFSTGSTLKIEKEEVRTFPFVTDYIRFRGYFVNDFSPNEVTIRNIRRNTFSSGNAAVPTVYLDGVPINTPGAGGSSGLEILYQLPTSAIEDISINKNAIGAGNSSFGGVIRITTRKSPLLYSRKISGYAIRDTHISKTFTAAKKFYTPKYSSFQDPFFEKYGVIHWESDIMIDENGKASFKIPNTRLKNISFFIEGMGKDGGLISVEKNLNFSENQ